MATRFGSEGYQGPDPEEVLLLREVIRSVLEAPDEPVLEYRWGAPSPLQGEILHAWIVQGQDPETPLRDWIQKGAPLGINVDIPNVGVFPRVEDDRPADAHVDAGGEVGPLSELQLHEGPRRGQ